MERLVKSLFAALFTCGVSLAYAVPAVDKPAPEFTAVSADGEKVSLKDYKGKAVILEWTNAECPFVQKHYGSGNMQALQSKYVGDDVAWLSVVSSAEGKQGYVTSAEAKKLTADRNANPTEFLLDTSGEMGKMYGAKTTPHMYIIDPRGILRYMGAIDSIRSADPADIPKATNYVDQAMAELTSGKKVSEPVTQAYGCAVKY